MHVVVARRKFLAEFRGNDAGAAVSRIAVSARRRSEASTPAQRLAARMAAVFEPRKFRVLVLY